jgi:hypothetical protein
MAYENSCKVLLASAARTATLSSDEQLNSYARGVEVIVDMTVDGGTDTVTVTIEGKDPASGKFYTILASTALTAVATTVLRVYPGLVVAANATANDVLPKVWRVTCTHSGVQSFTYSVGANLVL